jgi:hypothetical protein
MDFSGLVGEHILGEAVQIARAAPSIFHTRPWQWHAEGPAMWLRADRSRQLYINDPAGRLLVVSCGAALHHACLALAVMGHALRVDRLPDPADPDLLAVVRLAGSREATAAEHVMYSAIAQRRTARRAYTTEEPSDTDALVSVAEQAGAHLYVVGDSPGDHARPEGRWAVVFTDGDTPSDWLRAGEALSAVLLTGAASGLATAPSAEVTDTALNRDDMRRMLGGIGHPQLGLRLAHTPAASRRYDAIH